MKTAPRFRFFNLFYVVFMRTWVWAMLNRHMSVILVASRGLVYFPTIHDHTLDNRQWPLHLAKKYRMTQRTSIIVGNVCRFGSLPQSIGASNGHRWIAGIFYGGADNVHRWVLAQCIMVDTVYRWMDYTIYCHRQLLSIDTSHNQLWLAMTVNGHASYSNVFVNGHCRPQ